MKLHLSSPGDARVSLEPRDGLQRFFVEKLAPLTTRDETRAYIAGVCSLMAPRADLSQASLVLHCAAVQESNEFEDWVSLGDWILWAGAWAPQSLVEPQLALSIGSMAYARCHRLMQSWALFDELSSSLPRVIAQTRFLLSHR